jgi:4-amino-4-deoxy-L-arabinose transferase-like glycosyltransferase
MNPAPSTSFPNEFARFRRAWKPMLIIFSVAFVLRLAVFLVGLANADETGRNPAFFWYDSGQYIQRAQSVVWYGTYTVESAGVQVPDWIRPPGYPLFLAACYQVGGERMPAVLLPQIMLGALSCSLAFWFAAMLFGGRVGWITGGLMALCQIQIAYTNKVLTETFSIFWFVLSTVLFLLYLVQRRPWLLGFSGLSLGMCTLAHAGSQLYWVVPVFSLAITKGFTWRQKTLAAAVFLVSFLVLPSAWQLRNLRVFGVYLLAPKSHTLIHTAALVLWHEQPGRDFKDISTNLYARVDQVFAERCGLPKPDWQDAEMRHRYFPHFLEVQGSEANRIFREHARTYARLAFRSFLKVTVLPLPYAEICRFAQAAGPGDPEEGSRARMARAVRGLFRGEFAAFGRAVADLPFCKIVGFGWNVLYWLLTIPTACLGGYLILRQKNWPAVVLLLGTIAYFAVTTSIIQAGDGMQRYRLRLLPYLYCVAAAGWVVFAERRKS